MDKPELKPCPFCGGENVHVVKDGELGSYICCYECLSSFWQQEACCEEDNVEAWNRRAEQTGEWLEDEYGYCRCSRCGYEHDQPETTTPYCPECGTRMDGIVEVSEK